MGIVCCHGCGAIYCHDVAQDNKDHSEFHHLVQQGAIPYQPVGKGPLRSLRGEINRARGRKERA